MTMSASTSGLEYMTTHDIVWINTTVTGRVNDFDYVMLEAAMAAQYRYGCSRDVTGQAAEFMAQMVAHPPFLGGNLRTAFIATLTFLNANGYATKVDDRQAAQLIAELKRGAQNAGAVIAALAAPAAQPFAARVTLRRLITYECNLHEEALQILTDQDD